MSSSFWNQSNRKSNARNTLTNPRVGRFQDWKAHREDAGVRRERRALDDS